MSHVTHVWHDSSRCVWHDSSRCVWHDSSRCVWHDSSRCVWHDPSICLVCVLIHVVVVAVCCCSVLLQCVVAVCCCSCWHVYIYDAVSWYTYIYVVVAVCCCSVLLQLLTCVRLWCSVLRHMSWLLLLQCVVAVCCCSCWHVYVYNAVSWDTCHDSSLESSESLYFLHLYSHMCTVTHSSHVMTRYAYRRVTTSVLITMGWLQLVGSIKL